jgi:hypothetical protein
MDFSTFRSFAGLGFGHITAPGALDHVLFLLALAAIYKWSEWRQALVVVTAFTVGHSITLSLAVLAPELLPSSSWVEFLIPVTIVIAGVENVLSRARTWRRAMLTGVFGLVHGAGFAGYLTDLLPGSIGVPLFGFNVGLELGQAVVLVVAILTLAGVDRALSLVAREQRAFQIRVAAISLIVAMLGSVWAVERVPW